ncbi:MAG: hypothetical protein V4514_20950 [Pseudomonadota bacterium]|uniref:hypothetical protein n=1 Tax=unclassified Phenylobacterium TaxID=2640670 RepID=UPI0006FD6E7F|nr:MULTISPECIES: hypothetical protein [unclassified Phenylobacterium]KRB51049.1 hypothetical protein ASE02_14415 [Phenylobacterium sp. Root700]MBT9472764.1 hypothetical protein [Phenylobacterium sp.]
MNLLIVKRALGLFSIGLGVLAVAAPDKVARFLGIEDEQAMSAFGAREIASGSGLLSPVRPGPWFWLRAGGDVLDLAALSRAVGRDNPRRAVALTALGVVAAIAVFDFAIAAQATLDQRADRRAAV